jgi:hypothetical protein
MVRGRGSQGPGHPESDVAARGLYDKLGFNNPEGKPDGPVDFFYERDL